jgi:hypothetical protein
VDPPSEDDPLSEAALPEDDPEDDPPDDDPPDDDPPEDEPLMPESFVAIAIAPESCAECCAPESSSCAMSATCEQACTPIEAPMVVTKARPLKRTRFIGVVLLVCW